MAISGTIDPGSILNGSQQSVISAAMDMPVEKLRGSALEKSLAILDVVSNAVTPVSLTEIASALGIPKQTAHRLTAQLLETGLLRRDPHREHYAIGHRAVGIGLAAMTADAGAGPVDAMMRALVDEIGETCNLGVVDRSQVLYIHRVECDWPLRTQLRPGTHVPLHATAIGKLFLAWFPKRTRRRIAEAGLKGFTKNTITDAGALEEQVQVIRERGYSLNNEENMDGLIGIAVPVFGSDGKPIAGLSVHAPVFRLPLARVQEHYRRLQKTADELAAYYNEMSVRNGDE